jgi:hypothetical protein
MPFRRRPTPKSTAHRSYGWEPVAVVLPRGRAALSMSAVPTRRSRGGVPPVDAATPLEMILAIDGLGFPPKLTMVRVPR